MKKQAGRRLTAVILSLLMLLQSASAFADSIDAPETSPEAITESAGDTPATFIVDNQPGVALPSTGGEGTAPYIVTGITLMALAGMILLDRKRKDQK